MISVLCFSKDRPLQLDGYLRSLARSFGASVEVTVLYCASSDVLESGFGEVAGT